MTIAHDGDPSHPLAGVKIALIDADGGLVATTTTDEGGNYLFTGLVSDTRYWFALDEATIPEGIMNGSYYFDVNHLESSLFAGNQGAVPNFNSFLQNNWAAFTLNNYVVDVRNAHFSFVAGDYGDLPLIYESWGDTNAAVHTIPETGGIYLGQEITVELNNQPSYSAADAADDGVRWEQDMFYPGTVQLTVCVQGDILGDAILGVWADWDADGVFQEDEFTKTVVLAGCNLVSVIAPEDFDFRRVLFVRFRLFDPKFSPEDSIDFEDFSGIAINGEVEDYISSPTAVTLSNSAVTPNGRLPLILLAGMIFLTLNLTIRPHTLSQSQDARR